MSVWGPLGAMTGKTVVKIKFILDNGFKGKFTAVLKTSKMSNNYLRKPI